MAERLSKISEYLNTNNHEAAMRAHNEYPQATAALDAASQLQLARAFFYIANDYKKAI